jgi:hypothetical protein
VHSSLAMVTIGSKARFLFNSHNLVLRSFINYHYQLLRILELNCSLSFSLSVLSEEQLFVDLRLRSRSTCHPLLNLLLLVVGYVTVSLGIKMWKWQSLFLKRSLFCRHWQSQIMEVMQALWELQQPRLSFWCIWILQESIKEDFQYSLYKATSLLFCFSLSIVSWHTLV